MSSNPLMMGYGGGDLLRTGTVWSAVGSPPRPVCAGRGQWPVRPAAPGPWRERIRGGTAGPPASPPAYGVHDDALYKSTAFTFTFTLIQPSGTKMRHDLAYCMDLGHSSLRRPTLIS